MHRQVTIGDARSRNRERSGVRAFFGGVGIGRLNRHHGRSVFEDGNRGRVRVGGAVVIGDLQTDGEDADCCCREGGGGPGGIVVLPVVVQVPGEG